MADALDDGLWCPVCVEYFNDPKEMSCGHTFCKNCLDKLYRSGLLRKLTCPICREVTPVPDGDVSKLPTNTTKKGLVDDFKSATSICTANCEATDQSPAVSFCQTCGYFMCQSCHDVHGEWKKNADHGIVSVDDIKAGTVRIKQKCKKHPTDMEDYVCKTCKKSVCFKCRMLICEKAGHVVIGHKEYITNARDNIDDLSHQADSKIKTIVEHRDSLNQQIQKAKDAVSGCRRSIQVAFDEVIAMMTEKRNNLVKECDNHESKLLERIDKLAKEDSEFIESLSNASELVSHGLKELGKYTMEAHDSLCEGLDVLLKTDAPDLTETNAITMYGELLGFKKKQVDIDFGEIGTREELQLKTAVAFSRKDSINDATVMPDNRIAVGSHFGGIQIFSVDGQLERTVLDKVSIVNMAFLSDRQCIVQTTHNDISLYTESWKKRKEVRFDTLDSTESRSDCLATDGVACIYAGYELAEMIQVFNLDGGKSVMEIRCGGFENKPLDIQVLVPRQALLVKCHQNIIRVLNHQGALLHELKKDEHDYLFPALGKNGTVIVGHLNKNRDRISIHLYTSQLRYIGSLVTDHVIEQTERPTYCIQQFKSGEIALCTTDKLYIFN